MNTYPYPVRIYKRPSITRIGWFWTLQRTPDDFFKWHGYALTKRGAKRAARRIVARDRRRGGQEETYELGGES